VFEILPVDVCWVIWNFNCKFILSSKKILWVDLFWSTDQTLPEIGMVSLLE